MSSVGARARAGTAVSPSQNAVQSLHSLHLACDHTHLAVLCVELGHTFRNLFSCASYLAHLGCPYAPFKSSTARSSPVSACPTQSTRQSTHRLIPTPHIPTPKLEPVRFVARKGTFSAALAALAYTTHHTHTPNLSLSLVREYHRIRRWRAGKHGYRR